jgi:hypothetical protein
MKKKKKICKHTTVHSYLKWYGNEHGTAMGRKEKLFFTRNWSYGD